MASHPVESYLKNLSEIYHTGGGVAEESFYGALETLLNEIGRKCNGSFLPVGRCKGLAVPRALGVACALAANYHVD